MGISIIIYNNLIICDFFSAVSGATKRKKKKNMVKVCKGVLLSLLSVLMASSTMQSGLKPCVLDSRPRREAIFSLTELSVSWERTPSSAAAESDSFVSAT